MGTIVVVLTVVVAVVVFIMVTIVERLSGGGCGNVDSGSGFGSVVIGEIALFIYRISCGDI